MKTAAISTCMGLAFLTASVQATTSIEQPSGRLHLRANTASDAVAMGEHSADSIMHFDGEGAQGGTVKVDATTKANHPLEDCKKARNESWVNNISLACVYRHGSSGYDFFYKLKSGAIMLNCNCESDDAAGMRKLFVSTAVLMSEDVKGAKCYSIEYRHSEFENEFDYVNSQFKSMINQCLQSS